MNIALKENTSTQGTASNISAVAIGEISAVATIDELEKLRVHYLGKSGIITERMKSLGSLPAEEKKAFGQETNEIKNAITAAITEKKEQLEREELNKKLNSESLDITIPTVKAKAGSIHPVTQVIEEITEIFANMGFKIAEGPEIEDEYNNFTALNIPKNHPARQMHDTFYINGKNASKEFVLRTHTSPVQIRTMKENKPPMRFIVPGRTFRCDSDQTHSPMFHQIEGFYIDENVNMGMLKGCLQEFVERFFGVSNIKMRFRSSFFPFTEPSAEVDIGCSRKNGKIEIGAGDDWLEVLGCGMIHPQVLKNGGIDAEKYSGFAFGMGVERLAMLKYGISDLRMFFESDVRFLNHYNFSAFDIPSAFKGW